MKKSIYFSLVLSFCLLSNVWSQSSKYNNNDFKIKKVSVSQNDELGISIWKIETEGKAGGTIPVKAGKMDGAVVLAYVFPTNLKPNDVGFSKTEGIVALALTSHPDFDDTPLWDENSDKDFENDGAVWHPHWVVLQTDKRVKGGFSVKQFKKADKTVILPPTNPGMPMYMDSPGFSVKTNNNIISVIVPNYRMGFKTDFQYDGLTALLKVNTSDSKLPMLGVYDVFSIASGDLSLPFKVN